jgi:hypothetical protein
VHFESTLAVLRNAVRVALVDGGRASLPTFHALSIPVTYMSKKPRPSSVPSPSVAPIINRVKAKGHGLGRLASVDIRDHAYLAKPRRAAANVRSRYYYVGKPEDQGQTPQCVGYSTHKFLTAGPVRNVKGIPTPTEIYAAAQTRDEWPGEDYDGTSVRGAFKYLSEAGYIGEYNWAFDLETCVNWLLTVGPMVVGTIWLADMFDPDAKGFLRVSGDNVGGHAQRGRARVAAHRLQPRPQVSRRPRRWRRPRCREGNHSESP